MIFKPIFPLIPFAVGSAAVFGLTAVLILLGNRDRKKKLFGLGLVLALFALLFAIELRPMQEEEKTDVEVKNTDVLFIVDSTISMWAEDGTAGTRMDDVKSACLSVMDGLQGASFGVVSFDSRSRIMAPFTQDVVAVEDALEMIYEPDPAYAKGSSLNAPLADMESMALSSKKHEDRLTVMLFFSDGEITNGKELVSYEVLRKYVDYGAVLGVGTPEGGRMKDPDGFYIRDDQTYEYGISVPDEENLRQIAEDIGVSYIHIDSDAPAAIASLTDTIREKSFVSMGQEEAEVYRDTYHIYAILLLLVLAVGTVLVYRRMTL